MALLVRFAMVSYSKDGAECESQTLKFKKSGFKQARVDFRDQRDSLLIMLIELLSWANVLVDSR